MKYKEGDKVVVIQKSHPWQDRRRVPLGTVGEVVKIKHVARSKNVPNGIIVVIKSGTKTLQFPTRFIKLCVDKQQDIC